MDEPFREIYAAIYVDRTSVGRRRAFPRQRGYDPFYDEAIAAGIRDAIERAQESAGVRLREDAKALLAVNFEDMVFYPLSLRGTAINEALDDVAADIQLLTHDAAANIGIGEVADVLEISGHGVIDALSRNWSSLRVSRFRLWDRSDE